NKIISAARFRSRRCAILLLPAVRPAAFRPVPRCRLDAAGRPNPLRVKKHIFFDPVFPSSGGGWSESNPVASTKPFEFLLNFLVSRSTVGALEPEWFQPGPKNVAHDGLGDDIAQRSWARRRGKH